MDRFLDEVIDLVDTAATNGDIDWDFLQECVDASLPGVGDHRCSSVLANVVARCVIRTRIREGADSIPTWALVYLADITVDDDGEWAWESTAAFGWAIGHPEVAVLDRALERAEDLLFVDCLGAVGEQDSPDFPQYWEPQTELEYEVERTTGPT